jgi:hypothetical protein
MPQNHRGSRDRANLAGYGTSYSPAPLTTSYSSPPQVLKAVELTAVEVAKGAPASQDTTMVTVSCPPVNVTWASVAGPRTTLLEPKPC